jgi:rhodanese-related sulfurtransferase
MNTISNEQLKTKKNSITDLTLINTLAASHFNKYKITGSINIPQDLEDFVQRVETTVMNNKAAEIVVYCANQECDSSTQAAQKLIDAGFTNVSDYPGGAEAWNAN